MAISISKERPEWHRRVIRFALLWSLFFFVVLVFALLESFLLWKGGFRYAPTTGVQRAWIEDLVVHPTGEVAATVVKLKRNALREGIHKDIVLVDLRRRDALLLGVHELDPLDVVISPDARSVLFSSGDGSIYSVSLSEAPTRSESESRARQVFSGPSRGLAGMVFSPDGRKLAAYDDHHVFLIDWPTGKLIHKYRFLDDRVDNSHRSLTFCGDSINLMAPGQFGGTVQWNTEDDKVIRTLSTTDTFLFDLQLCDDDNVMVVANTGSRSEVAAFFFHEENRLWSRETASPLFAVSKEGDWVAASVKDGNRYQIEILDLYSGEPLALLDGHDHRIVGLACTSNLLVSWDSLGNIRRWDLESSKNVSTFSILDWARDVDFQWTSKIDYPVKF